MHFAVTKVVLDDYKHTGTSLNGVCPPSTVLISILELPDERTSTFLSLPVVMLAQAEIDLIVLSDLMYMSFQVVEVGKAFFPNSLSTAFGDPRLKLMFDDAARYLREEGKGQNYDVIICDSSDPVGPAEVLFKPEFFLSMKEALAPGGVLCTQGECLWLHLDLIARVFGECKSIFPSVRYGYTTIPTYPSGQIGFIVASNDAAVDPAVPSHPVPADMPLRYYSANIHKSAFVLPGRSYYCSTKPNPTQRLYAPYARTLPAQRL